MDSTLHSLLAEPKIEDPPPAGWFDGLLVLCVLCGLTIEAFVRTDLLWKPVALIVTAVLSFGLLIRRRRPLLALTAVISSFFIFDVSGTIAGRGVVEVYSAAFVLILIYAVFRWGSGQDAARALGVLAVMTITIQLTNFTNVGDMIGGTFILLFTAAVGTVVRYQRSYREQRVERIKSHEREQLARDLHDTVAHHVSAIAVQAQAGQVIAQASPQGAVDALAIIEEEASRTLAEMRAIVRALRDDDDGSEHAPQQGIADIPVLASTSRAHGPAIEIDIDGDLRGLSPSIDAAVFRLTQESITNAVRHARNASHVLVKVSVDANDVRLSVTDDGEYASAIASEGWGLVGMAERAELLGGTLQAGPGPQRGWQVRAVLPRDRSQLPSRS